MAKARRRALATDLVRFPNFEGIGPDITGFPQASVEPGARRGNIGVGALGGAVITRGPTRLESLKGLGKQNKGQGQAGAGGQGGQGRGGGRGLRAAQPDFTLPVQAVGNVNRGEVQGRGTLNARGRRQAAAKGKAGGRGVRG